MYLRSRDLRLLNHKVFWAHQLFRHAGMDVTLPFYFLASHSGCAHLFAYHSTISHFTSIMTEWRNDSWVYSGAPALCKPVDRLQFTLKPLGMKRQAAGGNNRAIIFFATCAAVKYFPHIYPVFLPKDFLVASLHGKQSAQLRKKSLDTRGQCKSCCSSGDRCWA
jgi:hypothetical protein